MFFCFFNFRNLCKNSSTFVHVNKNYNVYINSMQNRIPLTVCVRIKNLIVEKIEKFEFRSKVII